MTDFALNNRSFFYMNFRKEGNSQNPQARIKINSSRPLISPLGSNYCVCVSRFCIPLQNVPYRYAQDLNTLGGGHAVDIFDAANNTHDYITFSDVYSINDFLNTLNVYCNGGANVQNSDTQFRLQVSGKIDIRWSIWGANAGNTMTLSPILANIIGFPQNNNLPVVITRNDVAVNGNIGITNGAYSVLDKVDQVQVLRIVAEDLPVQTEIFTDGSRDQVLTDFIVPRSYSFGWSENPSRALGPFTGNEISVNEAPRQDIVFTPQHPFIRPLQISVSAPVYHITLSIMWIGKDGSTHNLTLGPESAAEIKLLFISKTGVVKK